MPYSQIIALMLALLIVVDAPVDINPFMSAWSVAAFWLLKATAFALLVFRLAGNKKIGSIGMLQEKLQWLSLFALAIDFYVFDLKIFIAHLIAWPTPGLVNICSLGFYLIYLIMAWAACWLGLKKRGLATISIQDEIDLRLRLVLPAIIPYLAVTLAGDIIGRVQWPGFSDFINSPVGETTSIGVAFIAIIVFVPLMIKSIWRCTPLSKGYVRDLIEDFLADSGTRYREILLWSLGGQGLCTAAVLGVAPRFRYILLTPCLIQNLTPNEIKAVLAHETAHVKKKHILWYFIFIGTFGLIIYNIFNTLWMWLVSQRYFLMPLLYLDDAAPDIFPLLSSLPLGLMLVLYFRFFIGYFMRNFEREADLAVFDVQGHPQYLINALEKVASISGINKEQPNWHHYGIAQRVDFLQAAAQNPKLKTVFLKQLRQKKALFLLVALFLAAAPDISKAIAQLVIHNAGF
ncbi:M48 family metallopeptidase [Dissulfurimicrobium hydrothermale]|uniref:M48 family metallopeptidase n=1 Tax=Dissulfurimicrobium hydrothermale TaxID=1750598 RepID=UPI001EDBF936|nr:M48 family metallopeptidase [Dissulfurimicrobium hydrothermale]UKL13235.1 M48 family metallopeptidase [Dissulfurimicrobium hydrothermale]